VLRHFSQRRVEIMERAVELVGVGAAGELSRERMQGIALATRKAKSYGVDGGTWREQSRARAAEHGLAEAELASLRARAPANAGPPDLVALTGRLSGPDGLTGRHNTFARRHALAEIAGAFPQGATISELEGATSSYLHDVTVVRLSAPECERRYTTRELLACEHEIVDGAERRDSEDRGVIPQMLVDRSLAQSVPALIDDQAAAVRAITTSGRGVEAISALAGTGKTTMIAALASAYRQAGWRVIATAPTARAARQLREVAGIQAGTMHSLLASLEHSGPLDARTVLVLDEAGMAPTRRSAQLFAYAELAGAKVVAVGDPGQLGSVEAGGWLGAVARGQRGPVLRQVMRQHNQEEQRALEALHHGDPSHYLAHKQDQITVHETEVEAVRQLSQAWYAAQHEHGPRGAVMISRDNLARERLNRAARASLKHAGLLSRSGVIIGGREYAPRDRVIARRNDRRNDLDNGTLATVIAVDQTGSSIIVETDSHEPRVLDPDYITQHLEHAYALTAHSAQGATVTWAAVIGRPGDFTREWAYTALSRAREETTIHLVRERAERQREREEYAPAEPDLGPNEPLCALHQAMKRSEREALAVERGLARPPEPAPTQAPPAAPIARASKPNGLELLRHGQLQRAARKLTL
jgi:hypothetical protein